MQAGKNKNEVSVQPYKAPYLFSILRSRQIKDLAQLYTALAIPGNEYMATLGDYFQSVGVSAMPGQLVSDPGVDDGFSFKVRRIITWNGQTYTLINATTFQPGAIQVEVFDKNWNAVCICGTGPDNLSGNLPYYNSLINVAQDGTGQGKLAVTSAAWTKIVSGQGYYWVVQARRMTKASWRRFISGAARRR